MNKICPICKKDFFSYNKGGYRGYTKFCSIKCKNLSQVGVVSPLKGRKTGETWNRGLTKYDHPSIMEYSKKKLGEKNPMWKGGIDGTSYAGRISGKENYRFCPVCGTKAKLNVHHKNKDRQDNRPENLEVLCPKCHFKEHFKNFKYERVNLKCEFCGKTVSLYPYRAKQFRFCSKSCCGKNMCARRWHNSSGHLTN